MSSRQPRPRGLQLRSLLAAAVFGAAVLPGWMLDNLAERWTGWVPLGYLVSAVWSGAAVAVLAPRVSYRRRAALVGMVPILGWYLICVLAWRVAFLPYRDWEPRREEMPRARWLTDEDHLGIWRMDPVRSAVRTGRPARPTRAGGRHPRTAAAAQSGGAVATSLRADARRGRARAPHRTDEARTRSPW